LHTYQVLVYVYSVGLYVHVYSNNRTFI